MAGKRAPYGEPDAPAEKRAEIKEAKPAMPAPDEEYLKGLVKEKEQLYADDDDRLDKFRQLVYGKLPTNIPEKYRHTSFDLRLSDLDDEISRQAAMITEKDPVLQVKPLRPGDNAEMNATKRKHHTEAALKYAGKRAQGVDCWRAIVLAVLRDGAAVSKFVYRPDLWAEAHSLQLDDFGDDEGYPDKKGSKSKDSRYVEAVEDAQKAAGPPVAWVPIDLQTWFPVWDDLQITESLEVTERPTYETLRKYRLKLTNKGNKVKLGKQNDGLSAQQELSSVGPPLVGVNRDRVPDKLKVVEHWDKWFCTIAVSHQSDLVIVDQYEHGYGRLPIFFTAGRNYQRGEKYGQSVVDSQACYVQLLNYLYNIELNVAIAGASPPVFHTIPEGGDPVLGEDGTEPGKDEPLNLTKWELGTVYHGRPGEDFKPLILPQISGDLKEVIEEVRERQKAVSMPRASAAIQGDLEGAGFALNQILSEIRAEKSDILNSLTNTLEEVTRFYWSLIGNKIQDVVYVEGVDPADTAGKHLTQVTLTPDDLKTQTQINWSIDWTQDAAQLVKVRMVHERLQAGTIGLDQAISDLGDNPDEVRLDKLSNWIREQPQYKNMALQGVMQAIGRGDSVSSAAGQIEGAMSMSPQVGAAANPATPPAGGPGMGPDAGAAAAVAGSQAPGRIIPPGPVPGSTPGPVVQMPRPGQATV